MDDEERTEFAQWSKDARRRSRNRSMSAIGRGRSAKQRLLDTEEMMERVVDDYECVRPPGRRSSTADVNRRCHRSDSPCRTYGSARAGRLAMV